MIAVEPLGFLINQAVDMDYLKGVKIGLGSECISILHQFCADDTLLPATFLPSQGFFVAFSICWGLV